MRDRLKKDPLRWLSLLAGLVLSAQFEYRAGRALGLEQWAAVCVPVMVDAYFLRTVWLARNTGRALLLFGLSVATGAVHMTITQPGARLDDARWLSGHLALAAVVTALIVVILWQLDDLARWEAEQRARAEAKQLQAQQERSAAAAQRARQEQDAERERAAEDRRRAEWLAQQEADKQREHELAMAQVAQAARVPAARTMRAPARTRRPDVSADSAGTGFPDFPADSRAARVAWFRAHLPERPDWGTRAWADAVGLGKTLTADLIQEARRPRAIGE